MAMLEVDGLCKTFRTGMWGTHRTAAVDHVTFTVPKGHTLGLVGMSGSGKSTVARLIMGLIQPDAGRIVFDGEDITHFRGADRRRVARDLQMLFQHPTASLHPRMLLRDSMREPFRLHPGLLPRTDWDDAVAAALTEVALEPHLLDRYPHQLSGGQLQRLCLARLLLLSPRCIVLDEPTSMLDVSVQAQVMNLLDQIRLEKGISYLFISHDLDLVRAYSEDIAVMLDGRLIEQQPARECYENPQEDYTKRLIAAFREM